MKSLLPAEARQSILNQILHPEAADRLGRIRLVKEERATDVENRLIMLAQSGQLRQKVTEEQLKELLSAVAENKDKLRRDIIRRLRSKGYDESRMLHRVRAGRMTDIDYLNGYFVKKGKELGIRCPTNEMVMNLVKAKLSKRRKEIEAAIPFEMA